MKGTQREMSIGIPVIRNDEYNSQWEPWAVQTAPSTARVSRVYYDGNYNE